METANPEGKAHQADLPLPTVVTPSEEGKVPQEAHQTEGKAPPEEGTDHLEVAAPQEEDGARPEAAAPQEEATLCSLTRLGTRTAEGVPGEDRQEAAHRTETGMTMIP